MHHQYHETLWGPVNAHSGKRHKPCQFCEGSKLVGILFPSDFDDRPPCQDGMVFISNCTECELYTSDVEAAEAISAITGWPILKSYDRDDEVDPLGRAEKRGTDYYRPYFAVTLNEAEKVVSR